MVRCGTSILNELLKEAEIETIKIAESDDDTDNDVIALQEINTVPCRKKPFGPKQNSLLITSPQVSGTNISQKNIEPIKLQQTHPSSAEEKILLPNVWVENEGPSTLNTQIQISGPSTRIVPQQGIGLTTIQQTLQSSTDPKFVTLNELQINPKFNTSLKQIPAQSTSCQQTLQPSTDPKFVTLNELQRNSDFNTALKQNPAQSMSQQSIGPIKRQQILQSNTSQKFTMLNEWQGNRSPCITTTWAENPNFHICQKSISSIGGMSQQSIPTTSQQTVWSTTALEYGGLNECQKIPGSSSSLTQNATPSMSQQNKGLITSQQTFQPSTSQKFAVLNELKMSSGSSTMKNEWLDVLETELTQNSSLSMSQQSTEPITSQQTPYSSAVANFTVVRNTGLNITLKQDPDPNMSQQNTQLITSQNTSQGSTNPIFQKIINKLLKNKEFSVLKKNSALNILQQSTMNLQTPSVMQKIDNPIMQKNPIMNQNPPTCISQQSMGSSSSQQTIRPSIAGMNMQNSIMMNGLQGNTGHDSILKGNSPQSISLQNLGLNVKHLTPLRSVAPKIEVINEWQRNKQTSSMTLKQNPVASTSQQSMRPITSQETSLSTTSQQTSLQSIAQTLEVIKPWQRNIGSSISQQTHLPSTSQQTSLRNIAQTHEVIKPWQINIGPSINQQTSLPSTSQQTSLPSIVKNINKMIAAREENPGPSNIWEQNSDHGNKIKTKKYHPIDTYINEARKIIARAERKRKAVEDLQNASKKSKTGKQQNINNYNAKSDYEKLLELENDLVINSEDFECLKCLNYVAPGDGIVLHECLHSFCRQCLILEVENSFSPVIKCPSIYEDFFCDAHLQEFEIKLLVSADLYERHLQLSATIAEVSAENSYHCATSGCQGWCFYEEGVETFFCQICGQTNCISCSDIHEGKSCNQHRQNFGFNKKLKKQKMPQISTTRIGEIIFVCKSLKCSGFFIKDENQTVFECPVCNLVNCLSCEAIHDGISCKDYQDRTKLARAMNLRSEDNESDYEKLVRLATMLVPNPEPFSCPICFEDIPKGEGVILHECLHNFCRECLISTVKHSETPIVKCPFMGENYTCKSHLKELEIKSLVTPELYEKHLHRSLTIAEGCAENSFHCKTPDCPGWCLYEDNVEVFKCPVCQHRNCVICAAIHENISCKEFQENKENSLSDRDQQKKTEKHIQNLIKSGLAMHCPKCKIILRKEGGCDGLTCTVCNTDVCWATKGPRWGPDGKGDISGGCRCLVNGKRCHINCRHCH